MNDIENTVSEHEKRLTTLEVSSARLDERIDSLVRSTDNLKKSVWGFSFIMLLTIVYMALGKAGYKDVVGSPLLNNPNPPTVEVSK